MPGLKEQDLMVKTEFDRYRKIFEKYLEASTERRNRGVPEKLSEAMDYSLFAGGKRLRPVLCLAAAERFGCRPDDALPPALGLRCSIPPR